MNASDPLPARTRMAFVRHLLRTLTGGVFLLSGFAKILSLDAFELYIFSHQLTGFDLSTIAARLIIAFELAIGLLLVLNIGFRTVYRLTLALLALFSAFLLWKVIAGADENCNCFGELIIMNPLESLIKNLVLMGLLFLIRRNNAWHFRFRKPVAWLVIAASLATPFIMSPPDLLLRGQHQAIQSAGGETLITLSDTTLNYREGKKVLVFMSMTCRYCILTAHKISLVAEKTGAGQDVLYYFFGNEANMEFFWSESKSTPFPYAIVPFQEILDITGGQVPTLVFTENGKVIRKCSYRDFTEKDFTRFFGELD